MAHDREFQRKRKDTRMPVRDSHGEDQPAARQTEQDFDLRRARDTPSSVNGKTHRQDIPVQTEFSHLSPETPESLLEQGEAYATALDGFSEHFETPDAARTAPPIQDNVRSNFRQEASRRFLVTENATDHDTGKYAPSSEGSATPDSTDRSSQEHRYRTHQHGNKYQQRFQEAAQAEEQAAQKEKGVDSEPPKTSKLEFTADELPPQTEDKKLTHARRKAERTAQKAEQAQNRLPARKKLRMETVSDPETGKAKKHLKFEKEVKSQKAHVKGPVPLRPVKAGANTAIGYAHKKIYEAEDENVGIKASHRSELVGEAGLRTAYHRHKTAPYRKAAKLQQKSAKANARLAYRQALSDHPELKKHAIARIWQKQKLKRQYAISEQQGQELYKQEEIAWVGEFFNAFSEQVNHSTVNFTYANADMLKSQSMPYSGDLPASENEIVVQESFLDSLGYSNELGQTIQIPFSDGTTHDFKLTGILDVKTGDIGRYTAIISKELVRQQYGDEGMIDYYIGLKGAQNMSEEEATNYANTLAQQLKISDDNVIVRSTYFNLKDENHGSDMLFYFLIGFVTFIGSGIVIYSIFIFQ